MGYPVVKRLFDIVASVVLLVVSSPLLLALGLLCRVRLGSPALFRQVRPGRDEAPFTLFKFRTMTDACGPDGELLPDEIRLTALGRFLRSTSLDELPELWNILIGEMSFVGPRPLLMEYLPHYSAEQRRRHQVRPGLTGLAQVSERNDTTWERRFERDLFYVDNMSAQLDLRILIDTVATVVKREGVTQQGHATMRKFGR